MEKNRYQPPPNPSTFERGLSAETLAERYLWRRGFQTVERNFRWRGGEIDLVMQDETEELVFVEVRSAAQPSPWLRYSIGPAKRARLIKSALAYCWRRPNHQRRPYRFDVVWVENSKVEHWKGVFLRG